MLQTQTRIPLTANSFVQILKMPIFRERKQTIPLKKSMFAFVVDLSLTPNCFLIKLILAQPSQLKLITLENNPPHFLRSKK